MSYIMLPQQERTKTGLEAFSEGASPYLQLAFQQMLKTQMESRQRERNIQSAYETNPEMFNPNYEGAIKARGFNANLSSTAPSDTAKKLYESKFGTKVPSKFLRFDRGKAEPGTKFNPITGEFSFDVPSTSPTIGVYTTTPEGIPQRTGEVPKGSRVLTPSQMETPEGKQQREISTAKEKKAEEAKMEVQAIDGMVESVWTKANELIPATEGVQSAAFMGLRKDIGTTRAGRLAGFADENAITFNEFKEGTLSMLIRSLGEKGMLTDQDIKRARDFEPSTWDTPKIRQDKRIAMKDFLKSKISAYFKNIQQPIEQQQQGNTIGRFKVEVQ